MNLTKSVLMTTVMAMLTFTPALAEDCKMPMPQLREAAIKAKVSVMTLSDADKAKVIEAFNAPPTEEPYTMAIVLGEDFARILIIKEDCIVNYSNDLSIKAMKQVLGLTEAGFGL